MRHPVNPPFRYGYVWQTPTFYHTKHAGIDYLVPSSTPIYACHSGHVRKAYSSKTLGEAIWLAGDDKETRYGHNSKLLVKTGERVAEGQIIALAGSTGLSTAPHCHLELRINGKLVDPLKHINQGGTVTQEQKDFEKAYAFWQYFFNERPPSHELVQAKVDHHNAIMQAQGIDETAAWHQIYQEAKLGK